MTSNLFALKESERQRLKEVYAAVADEAPLQRIERACAEIGSHLEDPSFAVTYAAILLATRDRIDEAKQLFARNERDPFCSVVREYLDRTNAFSFDVTIFADAAPYKAWFESQFHRQYQPGTMENVVTFAKEHRPPESNGSVTIVDVGTGNGILLEKIVNYISPLHQLQKVKLVLIDPSAEMLGTAKAHCEKNIFLPTETICLEGKIQHLSEAQWERIEQAEPIWFTNISLAIHHMQRREKLALLKRLGTLIPYVLFGEVNWTDELPKDDPQLAYITAKTYGLIFDDILTSPALYEDQRAAIYQFLLPEAISILKEEIGNRTDYHMTAEDWKTLAEEAGFEWTRSHMTTHLQGHSIAFVAQWRSQRCRSI